MASFSTRSHALLMGIALGLAAPAAAIPVPPPAPPPFEDPAIGARFSAWEKYFQESVNEAASKLAQARSARNRGSEVGGAADRAEKQAARDFAAAVRKSRDALRELGRIYDQAKNTASPGDLRRIRETLFWQREWFFSTEANTLEVLEALTD